MDRVGVIGLGKMGLPIARNLMVRGFRVTGYRRSGSPELISEGGDVAASAAEVAAAADVIVSIVPTADDVDEDGDGLVDAGDTVTYGFTVRNTSTVTLTDVTISDLVLGVVGERCGPATLAPGASATCTRPYVLTQEDLDAGAAEGGEDRGGHTGPVLAAQRDQEGLRGFVVHRGTRLAPSGPAVGGGS